MNRRAVVFCLLRSGCGGDKAGTVASDGAASPAQDGRGSETTTPQESRGQRTLTADERRAAGPVLRHFRGENSAQAPRGAAWPARARSLIRANHHVLPSGHVSRPPPRNAPPNGCHPAQRMGVPTHPAAARRTRHCRWSRHGQRDRPSRRDGRRSPAQDTGRGIPASRARDPRRGAFGLPSPCARYTGDEPSEQSQAPTDHVEEVPSA